MRDPTRALRVLVPLDGSALSASILPFARALGRAEILRLEGPADADAIVRRAREAGASLIALTTHGRSGFDRLVLGSVAEKVIRLAPVPVLALRAAAPVPDDVRPDLLGRVLVPYDGSDTAWEPVRALAALGDDVRGGRLELLGVVETLDDPKGILDGTRADLAARYHRLRVDGVRASVDAAAARARDLGFDARGDVVVGWPADAILDRAAATGATLIAIGSHGRSGISRWTLGSVAEKVLRGADVPVLICKRGEP